MANIYLRWKNPDRNGKAIEWEEMIRNFYISRLEYVPNVKCYYNETNNFIAEISTGDNIDDIYEFNPDTLIAIRDDGVAIDFINRIYLKTTISFSDNQCLAIGYVLDSNRDEFVRNNFYNDHVYSSLEPLENSDDFYYSYLFNSFEMFDYRTEESKNNGTGNCFMIFPKSEEVKISLYNFIFTKLWNRKLFTTFLAYTILQISYRSLLSILKIIHIIKLTSKDS